MLNNLGLVLMVIISTSESFRESFTYLYISGFQGPCSLAATLNSNQLLSKSI